MSVDNWQFVIAKYLALVGGSPMSLAVCTVTVLSTQSPAQVHLITSCVMHLQCPVVVCVLQWQSMLHLHPVEIKVQCSKLYFPQEAEGV